MRLTNLFRKNRINLHPKNAKPVFFYKSIHLQEVGLGYESDINRRGYTNNFMNTGQPGILVHGTPEGTISFSDGIQIYYTLTDCKTQEYQCDISRELSPLEFVEFLKKRHSIDLTKDKSPLHLICCFSGKARRRGELSIAQQLSNITQRPIVSYGLHEEVITRNQLKGLADIINGKGLILDSSYNEIKPEMVRPMYTTRRLNRR